MEGKPRQVKTRVTITGLLDFMSKVLPDALPMQDCLNAYTE